ncbi:Ig-like domain-containing protein [Nocardioides sp. SYSU D00038]|uniref:Ig-like domain-containing protein n=1 Tax=Nocardioides sp. SYSU D00038 TaxID=2812554 RepID=UPI001968A4E2|nr:Ig-like domain-containing protein [Nocardioides sp. SYSU D00038]
MRTILTATAAAASLALGSILAAAGPAAADITAPAAGATLRGTVTLSSSGVSDGSLCVSGSSPRVQFQLINSANQVVFESNQDGTGAKSVSLVTQNYDNGAYTVRTNERRRSGTFICSSSTSTFNRAVTIQNVTELAYGGATSAPQNTTATVSATLTDPNLGSSVLPGRSVSFTLSGGATVSATTNAQGVATASLPVAGPPRSATVTASYAGTARYTASSASAPFTVTKNASSTTLAPTSPVVHGQAVTFHATVAAGNGTGVPTGEVQFEVGGAPFGAPVVLDSSGAATSAAGLLPTGSHQVVARYLGDPGFTASASSARTQVVEKAATTTVLTSTGSPTVSGQAVTFTATVDVVAPGVGQPVGGVQFTVDGQVHGTAVTLVDGVATATIANLAPGNHVVTATYNGNADFATSQSNPVSHGVNRADTSVTLGTSNADAVAFEPLTFTAQVAPVGPGAGSPTGTVQFSVDGIALGDPVPVSGGAATSPVARLAAGAHTVTADYSGDAAFAGAGATLGQAVEAAQTATTVSSSPNPSVVGQSVTLRAEVDPVAPASGSPSGVVRFVVDGTTLGFVDVVDGAAELETAALTRGSHTVRATFLSADPSFFTSTSPEATHVVNRAATTTSLESSAPVSVTGQEVTFTATVAVSAPGAGAPSGTVTFTDGPTVLGEVAVGSGTGGQAMLTTSALGVGQHAVVATYSGDGDFSPSTDSVTQRVQRAQTSTLVTSSANPARTGQAVTFSAQVTPVAPGAGEPTGSVRFTVNGADLGAPAQLVDGVATSTAFAALSPGTYRVEARYLGDGGFLASSGLLDQGAGQAVAQGATTTTLTTDLPVAGPGQPVTFTATVAAVAPATGRPTGVVRFWEGQVLLGASSLQPAGPGESVASFVSASLAPGDHAVRAEYVGNFNFTGSVATVGQVVAATPTITGVEGSPDPATYGETVTLRAVVTTTAPAPGVPTGTVTFVDGDTVLGSAPVAEVDGRRVATLEVAGLGGGDHPVVATYSGDATHLASTSAPYVQRVERAATRLKGDELWEELGDDGRHVGALLTDADGTPLAGRTVSFTVVQPIFRNVVPVCEGVTGADGRTECFAARSTPAMITSDGYDLVFLGDADYAPSEDHAEYFRSRKDPDEF